MDFTHIPRRAATTLVILYQRTLSPDHSWVKLLLPAGRCRYYPSCSEYARQALLRHGVILGSWQAARRLLRCHPWAAGGLDPLPAERKV